MTKSISNSQPSAAGFWSKVKQFFEALEGLDETYSERLERRVSELENRMARLATAGNAVRAPRR
jgi:hypothetical protein